MTQEIQRWLAIILMIFAFAFAFIENGDISQPLKGTPAFASIFCLLLSIAISVVK